MFPHICKWIIDIGLSGIARYDPATLFRTYESSFVHSNFYRKLHVRKSVINILRKLPDMQAMLVSKVNVMGSDYPHIVSLINPVNTLC